MKVRFGFCGLFVELTVESGLRDDEEADVFV